ncbi:MAG TPA: hypothetical protein VGI43_14625 [Mucilaginibacter sp.]|jgi:hypothetical protein
MHIAYLSVDTIDSNLIPLTDEPDKRIISETQLRYLAYQTVCNKYSDEIASIQKYIPGWMPKFCL